MDLMEDYSWADEDYLELTQQQVQYHKNVSFMDTESFNSDILLY